MHVSTVSSEAAVSLPSQLEEKSSSNRLGLQGAATSGDGTCPALSESGICLTFRESIATAIYVCNKIAQDRRIYVYVFLCFPHSMVLFGRRC